MLGHANVNKIYVTTCFIFLRFGWTSVSKPLNLQDQMFPKVIYREIQQLNQDSGAH